MNMLISNTVDFNGVLHIVLIILTTFCDSNYISKFGMFGGQRANVRSKVYNLETQIGKLNTQFEYFSLRV